MDHSPAQDPRDLTSQVAELRALNAELGRALASSDAGTPLRSSITSALTLSRVDDAEQAAATAVTERNAAVAERHAALAERDHIAREVHELQGQVAEQVAEVTLVTEALAAQTRATAQAHAERDDARRRLDAASDELARIRALLGRRSVRAAQLAARAASPIFDAARRLRTSEAPGTASDSNDVSSALPGTSP